MFWTVENWSNEQERKSMKFLNWRQLKEEEETRKHIENVKKKSKAAAAQIPHVWCELEKQDNFSINIQKH